MRSTGIIAVLLGGLGAMAALGQIQSSDRIEDRGRECRPRNDSREPEVLKTCKVPPPARGGRPPGPRPAAAAPGPKEYTVTEIPGVVAAGQKWKEIWEVDGNNADGIIATKDGGLLIAQNDKSDVVKLDKNGKTSVAYVDTNTGGALAMNSKGALFVDNRGLNASVEELAPQRKTLANKYNGDSLDCIGGVLNDLTANSKGGVYFTMGGVFYSDPQGKVSRVRRESVHQRHRPERRRKTSVCHQRADGGGIRRAERWVAHQPARVREAGGRRIRRRWQHV